MTDNEKSLLLQLLLEDIRGNWGWENKNRVALARTLAVELNYNAHVEHIDDYTGDDGRHFRTSVTNGGYKGMSVLHGLECTIMDKSEEFKRLANDYITYPEHAFGDWEEYRNQD